MPVSSRQRKPDVHRVAALQAIRALVASLGSSARAVEQRTGVTNAQLLLLRHIGVADGLSVRDLAARVHIGESSVSIVVSRLVAAKLVAKRRSASDGRKAVLTLTARGQALMRNAPTPPTSQLIEAIAALNASQVQTLAAGLQALNSRLGVDADRAPLLFEQESKRIEERRPKP
jgi:DNA-binding MarR family transcriptional regulator